MKTFKPCVCIPSSGQVKAKFAVSLAGLAGYFSTHPLTPDTRDQAMKIFLIESSLVADNREKLVARTLETDCTHVAFADDDMAFPPDMLHRLALHNLPIVGTNYPYRTPGRGFTAGNLAGRPLHTGPDSAGLEEVAWIGFGFALIAVEVFGRLPRPWFHHDWAPHLEKDGGFTTEDVPFCNAARAAGYRIFVDHDASKHLIHVGTYDYQWSDPVVARKETA